MLWNRLTSNRLPTPLARPAVIVTLLLSIVATSDAYGQEYADDLYGGPEEGDVEFSASQYVRDASRDVLSRPEFRNLPRLELGTDGQVADSLKSKTPEPEEPTTVRVPSRGGGAIAQFIGSLFGGAISLVVVVVLLVVIGGILALILLGLRRWEQSETSDRPKAATATDDEEAEQQRTPGDRPPDAWLAAAREAASQGRYDEALSLLLLGALGHTERAGLIRPRRGLTYRDYLRAIPRSSAWYATLDRLIRSYAPIGFGRRLATVDVFEAAVGPYEAALAAEATPTGSQRREEAIEF